MGHDRYVIKNGKTYGPYSYESYRDGEGNVKKRYLGKHIEQKNNFTWILVTLLIFIGLLIILYNTSLTGKAVLSLDDVHTEEEILKGNMVFTLQQSEFIPAETQVIISHGENEYSYNLQQLIEEEEIEGNFFMDGTSLSGSGFGYGISQELQFPLVSFVLGIYEESEEEGKTYTIPVEQTEEVLDNESPEEIPEEENQTESGQRSISGNVISNFFYSLTGKATLELIEEINGQVRANESFVYDLEEGQTAQIISSDEGVDLAIENNQVIITTEYFGDEIINFEIPLDDWSIPSEDGELNVKFVYNEIELVSETKSISLEEGIIEEIPEEGINETEILGIPLMTIQGSQNTTTGNWENGTFNYTEEGLSGQLQINNTAIGDGTNLTWYTSEIFNAGSSVNWTNISWVQESAYNLAELPDNQGTDTEDYLATPFDMTGNVLLMHLNNDSSVGESSTLAYDYSGNGNNGTIENAIWTTSSKLGNYAVDFGGTNHRINITDAPSQSGMTDLTISFWGYSDASWRTAGTKYNVGVVKWNIGGADASYWFGCYNAKLMIFLDTLDPDYYNGITTVNCPSINEWHLWTLTYDGTTGTNGTNNLKIYIDGSLQNTQSSETEIGAIRDCTKNLFIGGFTTDAYDWTGMIDEVAIWNRTLSADEIEDLFLRGAGKFNVSVRSCDDASCDGEDWNETYTTPNSLVVDNNQYFQYLINLERDGFTTLFSPEFWNLSILYDNLPVIQDTPILNSSLGTNYTKENLTCWANASDLDNDNVSYSGYWYKNGGQNTSFSNPENYTSGTLVSVATLLSGNTSHGENWSCEVTPFDGIGYGDSLMSNNLTVLNTAPVANPLLNSTSGTNLTNENLTCHANSYDADEDSVTDYFTWDVNGSIYWPFYETNSPQDSNVVLLAHLNNESGKDSLTNVYDYGPLQRNGTITGGANWNTTSKQLGNAALSFNGSNYVTFWGSGETGRTENMTVSVWANPGNSIGVIWSMYDDSLSDRFFTTWNATSKKFGFFDNVSKPNSGYIYSANAFTDHEWHLLTLVRINETGNDTFMYVDGVLEAQYDADSTFANFSNPTFLLARLTANWADAGIDELVMWNRSLNDSEISDLYQKGEHRLLDNVLNSSYTSIGENWTCNVTPYDGIDYGASNQSNQLSILEALPYDYALDYCKQDNWESGKIYGLNTSLSNTSTCIIVNVSDIIIDCFGNSITGDNSGVDYGIYIKDGADNVTVKNCFINNFGSSNQASGIYIEGKSGDRSVSNIIFNNTFNHNYQGVYTTYSNNTYINNNQFNASEKAEIYIGTYNYNTNININAFNNTWSNTVNEGVGVYVYSGGLTENSSHNIENNIFDNTRYGIYLDSYKYNNTVRDNLILYSRYIGIYSKADWSFILNNTINNTITSSSSALQIKDTTNNTLIGNKLNNNYIGLYLDSVGNSNLSQNTIFNSSNYNFRILGSTDSHFDNIIDISNTINNKPIYYVKDDSNSIYNSSRNASTFYCINCNNVSIEGQNLSEKCYYGAFFWKTENSTLKDSIINGNSDSNIGLVASRNNIIENNTISKTDVTGYGVYLYDVNETLIIDNSINKHSNGIHLYYSNNNNFTNNRINSSSNAIYFNNYNSFNRIINQTINNTLSNSISIMGWDNDNFIINSTIANSVIKGIYSTYSNSPRMSIIGNSFIGLTRDAVDLASGNMTISGNNFTGITSSADNAVVYISSSYNTITNNNLYNNYDFGIKLASGSENNNISNNVIRDNIGSSATGMVINHDGTPSYNVISNNIIDFNGGGGISFNGGNLDNITNNTITNNVGQGLTFGECRNIISKDNRLMNNSMGIILNSGVLQAFIGYQSINDTVENNGIDFRITDYAVNNTITNLSIKGTRISFTGKSVSLYGVNSTSAPSDPIGYANIGSWVNITNSSPSFIMYLNFSYNDSSLPVNEEGLKVWRYNGSWQDTGFYNIVGVDTINNMVYANLTQTSIFAPLGDSSDPIVTLITPGNNTISSNAVINFTYNVTDSSDISNCSLYINEVLNQTNSTITKDVNQTFVQTFDTGYYNWSVKCYDVALNQGNSSIYYLNLSLNSAPTINSVILNSSLGTNYTNENLTCWVNASDSQLDDVFYNGTWYKNGVQNISFSTGNYASGLLVSVSTLLSENTSHGENWTCNVTPYDGELYGSSVLSDDLTILNSPPVINSIAISPSSPNSSVDLNCTYTSSDLDDDTLTPTFEWYNNSVPLGIDSQILGLGNTSVGEYWNCSINLSDGQDWVFNVSSSVIIGDDNPPSFSNPTNTSSDFKRYSNFTANITINNDNLDYYIFSTNASGIWTNKTVNINGLEWNASEQANITLAQGNTICWYYWANDTSGNNATSNTYCFVVQNTAPVVTFIVLNSTFGTNYTNENLTCWANSSDIDEGNLNYNGTWYKNGVQNISFNTGAYASGLLVSISTLLSENTSHFENWSCEVTPYDGELYGNSISSNNLTVLDFGCQNGISTYWCGDTVLTSCNITGDVSYEGTCFTIGADNVILDGKNYSITGNGSGYGINLSGKENVTIKNFEMDNFTIGIYVSEGVDNNIIDNIFRNNILWDFYSDNLSTGNNISNLTMGILYPTSLTFSYSNGIGLKGVESPQSAPSEKSALGKYANISNVSENSWINVSIKYETTDLNESTLRIYHYDGSSWSLVTSSVDEDNNVVYGNLSSFSQFGIFGEEYSVTPTPSPSGGGGGVSVTHCYEDWQCTNWDSCINGIQRRICQEINSCEWKFSQSGKTEKTFIIHRMEKPIEIRDCRVEARNISVGEEIIPSIPKKGECCLLEICWFKYIVCWYWWVLAIIVLLLLSLILIRIIVSVQRKKPVYKKGVKYTLEGQERPFRLFVPLRKPKPDFNFSDIITPNIRDVLETTIIQEKLKKEDKKRKTGRFK